MILAAQVATTKLTGRMEYGAAAGAAKGAICAMQHDPQTPGKALAYGLRMVMMGALSCGASGTRRRGVR